jgi:aspartate ammonia-lyase
MPGKVNPVIPEAVVQAAMMVMGYDVVLAMAVAAGNLELNQNMPLVACCLLESLDLLRNSSRILHEFCVTGITANRERCRQHVNSSTATITALVAEIGYDRAEVLAREARATGRPLRELAPKYGLTPARFDELVSPEAVNRLGSQEESRNRGIEDSSEDEG